MDAPHRLLALSSSLWLLLAPGCAEEAAPEAEATAYPAIDYSKVSPPGPGPFQLERAASSQLSLSVDGAIGGIPAESVKTYWFIDFVPSSPTQWQYEGRSTLSLCGCDAEVFGASGTRTVVVEVLITAGTLVYDPTLPDPRRTEGGEPIAAVRWTLVASGPTDPQCQAVVCPE